MRPSGSTNDDAPRPSDHGASSRTVTLVLAYLALLPMSLIWGLFLLLLGASSGAGTMAAVLPMIAYLCTGWAWGLIAGIALVRATGRRHGRHATVVAATALTFVVLGAFILVPR
ncbi:hypothetical protein [Leucobacter massiliensis]|uniref:Uncharacterized protein n=1 Tax=Leucobacter massiliensis TaxID=1686285 RepID=A0A2S9QLN1_9MICO|nr:hypothetical protein [Leucobacter massiliensis]PRI10498.1 hypothetical protein B4915_10850 [Leucobacter massiliensis]